MVKPKKEKIHVVKSPEQVAKLRNRWFLLIIIIFTLGIYINTARNHFCMDDYHVTASNPQTSQGFRAIPEIFATLYAEESGLAYGYRPLVRVSFTLDHELWQGSPYPSHFLNVLLYIAGIVLLFIVLRRILNRYNPYLPFIITLLYIAYPLHTEVVASLKNRDELLNLIFVLLALKMFVTWADRNQIKYLIFGLLSYLLAFLSKETAVSWLLVFPLTLYFFTGINPGKLWIFTGSVIILAAAAILLPMNFLPEMSRGIMFMENPLVAEESIWTRVATGMYVLLLYVKKLLIPYPMLYYYGYDTIPVKAMGDPWVIVSILFYLAIFIFAIIKFKSKHILSYAILFYLITIAMFTNVVMPVPGIMADRFLFFPSIGFAIVTGYLILKIFGIEGKSEPKINLSLITSLVIIVLILIPWSALTVNRNKNWRTYFELYNHDIKYLDRSVKAHDLLATELVRQLSDIFVNPDPTRIPPPVNSQKRPITQALDNYKRAIEIYPEHYSSWNNMGTIFFKILKQPENAILFYQRATQIKPDFPLPWFNLGQAYEKLEKYDDAGNAYVSCYKIDTTNITPMSRLANMLYRTGDTKTAYDINYRLMRVDPQSFLPYLNLGNYALRESDTATANKYLEKAQQYGYQGNIYSILSRYYQDLGDNLQAYNFYKKAQKIEKEKSGK